MLIPNIAKRCFSQLLKLSLNKSDILVDTVSLIITEAIKIAHSGASVLLGEDTDAVVMLIIRAAKELFVIMPGEKGKCDRIHSVRDIQNQLYERLSFVHEFTGFHFFSIQKRFYSHTTFLTQGHLI